MSMSKFVGIGTAIVLAGGLAISMAQTAVMMNTETPGASKDFAESSERGLREYESLVEKNSQTFDANGYPVGSADQRADRLIQESQELQEAGSATLAEFEAKQAELKEVDEKIDALCSNGGCPDGWENR